MEQEQKSSAIFIDSHSFSSYKNNFIRSIASITKIFNDVVTDYSEIPWTIEGLFPRDTYIDLRNERVCLALSDCWVKEADLCGLFIEARKTKDGFEVEGVETTSENLRQVIDQQVKDLIGNK